MNIYSTVHGYSLSTPTWIALYCYVLAGLLFSPLIQLTVLPPFSILRIVIHVTSRTRNNESAPFSNGPPFVRVAKTRVMLSDPQFYIGCGIFCRVIMVSFCNGPLEDKFVIVSMPGTETSRSRPLLHFSISCTRGS